MLTASAALAVLGPNYRFATQLLVDNVDAATGTARTLYIRGSGDPTLEVGDLAALASALKQAGVGQITGEIVIDDTDFDAVPWAQGWMWDDLESSFSAPVWGLNVAGNAMALWLMPGSIKNAPARLLQVPEAPGYVFISNTGVTTAAKGPNALKVSAQEPDAGVVGPPVPSGAPPATGPVVVALTQGQEISVTGTVGLDSPAKLKAFAIRDPVAWAGALLRAELRKAGVQAPVALRRGPVSTTAVPVALHESAALGVLLPQFVKASNNHAMECVLKRVSVAAYGAPGTFAGGTQAVRRYLSDTLGLPSLGMNLVDGSGASRYNLLTPAQLTRAICAQAQAFALGPEFMASLPVAGLDGTLARRFVGSPLQGRVRAKTGTMTGISSLAGLMEADDGDILCFAIMMDGALGHGEALRRLQDGIVTLVGQRAERMAEP
jgi:D-alanyl-D-alanine carboxypeptidase/D-alanyl-D-alanine-endopeptidase (penicillin-binding protein 4)